MASSGFVCIFANDNEMYNNLIQSIMTNENEDEKGKDEMMDVEIRERYVNPYTDFGFKKLFGTELNKDLLISFLNALLHDKPDITDLTYLNSERLAEGREDRKAVFDVYCRLADNTHIIVEMQKSEQKYFKDRSIYYSTFPIRDQAPQGKWNYHLKDVYTVGLLSFTFPDNEYPSDSFLHEIKLKDVEDNHVFYDKLTFFYLEMPKFKKHEEELVTMFDKWMYALVNLTQLLERPKALQERIFTRLFEQAEIASFTPTEREEYVASMKEYWDAFSIAETSFNKGKAEGIAEGMEKGRAEGIAEGKANERMKNARSLKDNGIPIDVSAKSLGLTQEEVDKL